MKIKNIVFVTVAMSLLGQSFEAQGKSDKLQFEPGSLIVGGPGSYPGSLGFVYDTQSQEEKEIAKKEREEFILKEFVSRFINLDYGDYNSGIRKKLLEITNLNLTQLQEFKDYVTEQQQDYSNQGLVDDNSSMEGINGKIYRENLENLAKEIDQEIDRRNRKSYSPFLSGNLTGLTYFKKNFISPKYRPRRKVVGQATSEELPNDVVPLIEEESQPVSDDDVSSGNGESSDDTSDE